MLDKTIKAIEDTFKIVSEEMEDIFKKLSSTSKNKLTKIKIKSGSIVTINGAKATLLNDVVVTTDDPDTLIKKE